MERLYSSNFFIYKLCGTSIGKFEFKLLQLLNHQTYIFKLKLLVMNQLKKILYSLIVIGLTFLGTGCTKTYYTTQSKASTYNDYKATKYNMKNKKKKKY